MAEEGKVTSPVHSSGGGRGGGRSNRRRRNKNRNKNKSHSPSRHVNGNPNNPQRQKTPPKSVSPYRQRTGKSKSRSPTRQNNTSRSPIRLQMGTKMQTPYMTVIVNRCDLWDSNNPKQAEENQYQQHLPNIHVSPFGFTTNTSSFPSDANSVAVARVPRNMENFDFPIQQYSQNIFDTSIPNPHDPNEVPNKYWAQRYRLFSKFDQGILLDSQGWYSVTPEIIADHVAQRVSDIANTITATRNDGNGIVLLDAFCGCGGNSIAFGKIASSSISKVICVDTDRSKLLKAAHNASLYGIPKNKLIFVECNTAFILKYCYKDGLFVLDQPTTTLPSYMPNPVMPTTHAGYRVGGLDMLPRKIDAVFMDPPWGGVDYEVLGKNGYDLKKNMRIRVDPENELEEEEEEEEDIFDDFFDSFASAPKKEKAMSKNARKANFNKQTQGEFLNGMELLKVAAGATSSHIVVYDLPRNTNKAFLGKYAAEAGYSGNIKLEEHFLNGRLKTVTAYMGADYGSLINDHTSVLYGDGA